MLPLYPLSYCYVPTLKKRKCFHLDELCGRELRAFLACGDAAVRAFHEAGKKQTKEWDANKITSTLKQFTPERKRGERDKGYLNVPYVTAEQKTPKVL